MGALHYWEKQREDQDGGCIKKCWAEGSSRNIIFLQISILSAITKVASEHARLLSNTGNDTFQCWQWYLLRSVEKHECSPRRLLCSTLPWPHTLFPCHRYNRGFSHCWIVRLTYFLGWLAIAKLKPLSLFISLLLVPKKEFDNVEIASQPFYIRGLKKFHFSSG